MDDGRRIRLTLKVRDRARAEKKLLALQQTGNRIEPQGRSVAESVQAYLATIRVAEGTRTNYRRVLRKFVELAASKEVTRLEAIDVDFIYAYRASRTTINDLTWGKELGALRAFFSHCRNRGWIPGNPAALVPMPKAPLPQPEPYSTEEVQAMLTACDTFGQRNYERKRARALLLLLRHTALRIGDVALMERQSVVEGKVRLRTEKNGKFVCLPLPSHVLKALEDLPPPKAAGTNPRYFFWSGHGTRRAMKRSADRTLRRVFEKSGVQGAHAHRFRHTMVVELLVAGATFEQISEIIRTSPPLLRKHYAPWAGKRQEELESLMQRVFAGTDPGTD